MKIKRTAIACLIATTFSSAIPVATAHEFISDTYEVQPGDTLQAIASRYAVLNTYSPREVDEFESGIVELNYDLLRDRPDNQVRAGDKLEINYWIIDAP